MGHKESYAERQLRPSISKMVKAKKNKKGHITGYNWCVPSLAPKTPQRAILSPVGSLENQLPNTNNYKYE